MTALTIKKHVFCQYLQKDLSIIFVSRVEDVLNAAFDGGFPLLKAHLTDIVSKL